MSNPSRPAKPHRSPAEVVRIARSHTARTGLVLAIVAVLALAFAPFGVREEMFDLTYAVSVVVLRWASGLAIIAAILAVLALLMAFAVAPRRGFIVPLLTLALAGGVMAAVGQVRAVVAANPPIHDVATDWTDPLAFGPSMAADRGPDANPAPADPRVGIQPFNPRLEGVRIADINARTCAAAAPAVITASVQAAYERVRAAMVREGMTLVTENPASGRLEATTETRWLRLRGDVVARVRSEGAGARIDFRSVSRTGEIDLGENCRRIGRLRQAVMR